MLEKIQHVIDFAALYEREFVELLKQNGADKSRKELLASKRKLTQAENRVTEIDHVVQRLYEDYVAERLSEERFMKLSKGYEAEQQKLQEQAAELAEQIATQEQKAIDLNRFVAQVRKHTQVEELTPTILNDLVERIEVHAPDKSSGKRVQEIDVHFNFVGLIGELEFGEPMPSKTESLANAGSIEPKAQSPAGFAPLHEFSPA